MPRKKKKRLYSFVALTAVFTILYYINPQIRPQNQDVDEQLVEDTIPDYVPNYYYGIVVDSLSIFEGTIKRNQRLADILYDYNVSDETLHQIAQASREVFDVRKFGARKPYSVLYKGDSVRSATHFIYRPNAIDYVVIDLTDSVYMYQEVRDIEVVERELAGDIQQSLYLDMLDDGGNVQLVNKLVDVFAWQVDFFGIQQGDAYKIIFDEHFVDGESVGVGEIKAGYFKHINEEYYAYQFNQGDGQDYFGEDGMSLRREFLKAPLSFTRISSRYTGRRYHPVQKRYKAHRGTDYAAPRGTPIFAAADGTIEHAKYQKYNGNNVKIKHNGNISTQYLHMSKIARGIRRGRKVKRGQVIGYVGSTGLASGPHLCYRFWKNGVQVDALKVKIPPSNPIQTEYKTEFDSIQLAYKKRLNRIHINQDSVNQVLFARAFESHYNDY